MKIVNKKQRRQGGFTIVELMIATMVFSTVLVVITFGILHFTNSYYKGLNSSTTQNTARSIMDGVAQTIQFSGSPINPSQSPPGGVSWFCAGYHTYVYTTGVMYTGAAANVTNAGLYAYANNGACPTAASPPTNALLSGGKQLLATNMRITSMSVSPLPGASGAYTVAIVLAYGDRDLLCSPSLPATNGDSCSATTPNTSLNGPFAGTDTSCRSSAGTQFCAVASLSTTVYTRVAVVKLENKVGIL